jgi:hypothetical protein
VKGTRRKKPVMGPRADPMAAKEVEAVAEAEVVAMVLARPVATASTTVTGVASWVIGPVIARASSPRRMNMLLQPKRRSRLSCSLRWRLSAH